MINHAINNNNNINVNNYVSKRRCIDFKLITYFGKCCMHMSGGNLSVMYQYVFNCVDISGLNSVGENSSGSSSREKE